MLALIVFLASILLIMTMGAKASLSDLKGLTIPNRYSIVALGIYGACFLLLTILGRADILPTLTSSLLAALIFSVLHLSCFRSNYWARRIQSLEPYFPFGWD